MAAFLLLTLLGTVCLQSSCTAVPLGGEEAEVHEEVVFPEVDHEDNPGVVFAEGGAEPPKVRAAAATTKKPTVKPTTKKPAAAATTAKATTKKAAAAVTTPKPTSKPVVAATTKKPSSGSQSVRKCAGVNHFAVFR